MAQRVSLGLSRVTRLHPDLDMTAGAHQDSDSTVWGSSEVIQAQPGFSGLVRAHQHSDVARQGSSGLRRCSPRVVEAHQGSSGLIGTKIRLIRTPWGHWDSDLAHWDSAGHRLGSLGSSEINRHHQDLDLADLAVKFSAFSRGGGYGRVQPIFGRVHGGGGTPSITPKQQNMCEHCLKLSAHGIDFSYAGGNGWGIHGGAAFRWGVGERHILGRWGSISPTGVNPTMGIISKIHNRAS